MAFFLLERRFGEARLGSEAYTDNARAAASAVRRPLPQLTSSTRLPIDPDERGDRLRLYPVFVAPLHSLGTRHIGAPNLGETPREDVDGQRDWWADE